MRPRAYPLQAVVLDRQATRQQCERVLARAQRTLQRAEAEQREAQAALDRHGSQRPLPTGASGRELQRSAAYARRHAAEARDLAAEHAAARGRSEDAERAVAAARAALAEAHAAERVLEQDRDRYHREGRKRAQAVDQEEADERASTRPPPR